jgi:hypothetical protein
MQTAATGKVRMIHIQCLVTETLHVLSIHSWYVRNEKFPKICPLISPLPSVYPHVTIRDPLNEFSRYPEVLLSFVDIFQTMNPLLEGTHTFLRVTHKYLSERKKFPTIIIENHETRVLCPVYFIPYESELTRQNSTP